MELIRRSMILLALALALGVSALPAQDDGGPTNADPAEPPADEAPADGGDAAPGPDEREAEADPVPEPGPAPRGGDEDVFVPTEELDADEEVTFPVDI